MNRISQISTDTGRVAERHVMVVDDDPFVRNVITTALAGVVPGAVVRAYATGAEAIAAANDIPPAVVLLDLLMPEMDGRATWRCLRDAIVPSPRLLFLTAHDDPSGRAELMALGAAAVITKPFEPRAMVEAVRKVMGIDRAAPAVRLAGIAAEFVASLPATIVRLDKAKRALAEGGVEAIHTEAHKLAGAAGLFRFDALGEAADHVEGLLARRMKEPRAPLETAALKEAVDALIAACRTAAA